jgi:hypothetical protein
MLEVAVVNQTALEAEQEVLVEEAQEEDQLLELRILVVVVEQLVELEDLVVQEE